MTIREALLREHYRGGQSFYVVPRISDLAEVEAYLKDHVPEVSFVVAHGQMPSGELDERMNAFYDGRYGVLLSTTIIESGLDIPAANTLIVERADMFGLAQLYQIRGRVGRSKLRAYAFFMTEPRKPLTPQAERRLRVLGALDSLGAGFTLASQDLDIRGAGNLLGEEQSGHVREVGFELYQEMLQEAIAKLQSGELELPDHRRLVAADQPRRAGADPRGLRARPRRPPRPLSPPLGAGAQGGDGGLRRRADRPLRPAAGRGRDADAGRAHQGALQARRHRQARRRAEGRDHRRSTATSTPTPPAWCSS